MDELPTEGQLISLLEKAAYACDEGTLVRRDWDQFLVVGDTHGNLNSTINALDISEILDLPIIFLGDYVDRGPKQLENLCLIIQAKLERGNDIILLRGNHEDLNINEYYGFFSVLRPRYSRFIYAYLEKFYKSLPLAALLGDRYFLTHGGIPRGISDLEDLYLLSCEDSAYHELIWNDPSEDTNWFMPNHYRGCYYFFGEKAVDDFMEKNGISYIIRGHTCHPEGYRWYFGDKLLSLFSSQDYCENEKAYYALVMNDKPEAKRLLKVY